LGTLYIHVPLKLHSKIFSGFGNPETTQPQPLIQFSFYENANKQLFTNKRKLLRNNKELLKT